MNMSWLETIENGAAALLADVAAMAPGLAAAIAVLFVGWIVAMMARGAVRRICNSANRMLERVLRRGDGAHARLSAPAVAAVSAAVYWAVLFLSVVIAARIAGLTLIANWLNQLAAHLPNILVGAAIIGFGYLAGAYVRRLVLSSVKKDRSRMRGVAANLAQGLVILTALIIGLDQIGVKVTFLVTLLAIVAGGALASFAIAFGLGARGHVSNLIGARTARTALTPGANIRIGETIRGAVLEVTPSQIVIDTDNGRMFVPARIIDEQPLEILTPEGARSNG